MKKLLLIAAMCGCLLFTSCKWYYENFSSVESCTEWYLEQLSDAIDSDDADDIASVTEDLVLWVEGLSSEDLSEFQRACEKWGEANPIKGLKVGAYLIELGNTVDSYDDEYYY